MADLKFRDKDKWKSLYKDFINNKLSKDQNLSDLTDVQEALDNLGLTGDNNHTHYHDDRYLPLIEKETNERKESDNKLKALIDEKTSTIISSTDADINNLQQTLGDQINEAINQEIFDRNEAINKEANKRKESDTKLETSITDLANVLIQETQNRIDSDNDLENKIKTEINDRNEAIKNEADIRKDADDELRKLMEQQSEIIETTSKNLEKETNDRIDADNELQNQINIANDNINSIKTQAVNGSQQAASSLSIQSTSGTPAGALYNKYTINTYTGIAKGTYGLNDLLNRLVDMSHTHSTSVSTVNCNCNCNCNTHSH